MQRKSKLVIIVLLSLFLIGGASMAVIKEEKHMRIEKQKRQKAESSKERKKEAQARQKIALWVVQHFEVPEPIKEIKVGKIRSYGVLGSGSSAVSVMINNNKKYVIDGISVEENGMPRGNAVYSDDINYVFDRKKTLNGIVVSYWEE